MVGFDVLQQQINLIRRFFSNAQTPDSGITHEENADTTERLKRLVDFDLVLAADYVHSSLCELTDEQWHEALPKLLNDFQQLLLDALDLLRELGEADDHSDRSNWDLPSISDHWQNRHFQDWVSLIVLLRDAWLATRQSDPELATQIAQSWFDLPYPTFKRLALFAASQEDSITSNKWVEWLLEDNAWWLWSTDSQRETMRLLVLQGANLKPEGKARLETGILAGPPRKMFREDIEPERWQSLVDNSVWLNLAKLREGSGDLGDVASQRFSDLSAAYPDWKLATNERDEFSSWMSGTGDPDYESSRVIDIAPSNRQELVAWLKKSPPDNRPFYEDNWSDTCRTQFIPSLVALLALTKEGLWPAMRWDVALHVWCSDDKTLLQSWRFAAPLMHSMPDDVFQEIRHSVTRWLDAASKSTDRHESVLLDLCRRALALPDQDNVGSDNPVSQAINHPVGHVTQALLNLWFKRELNDNDTLPTFIEPFFTELCNTTTDRFRHGRVLLASRLITLFRVDRPWTEAHLLPLFNWDADHKEAKAAWEGFLWSPRLYGPLLVAFKTQFLDTAHHYVDLGEHKRQFARFLTYAALDPADGFRSHDFETAITALPQEGLQNSAQALSQALEGAGNNREDYWENRVLPFWKKVWPKSSALATNQISGSLARLSIAAGSEFPSALVIIQDWLKPDPYPHYIIHQLKAFCI